MADQVIQEVDQDQTTASDVARKAIQQAAESSQFVKNPDLGSEEEIVVASFSQCFVGHYNPRPPAQVGDLTQLAESIKATGIQQMPLARRVGDRFEIVYGQRRFLAAQLAFGEEGQIKLLVKVLTDEEALLAALTENTNRKEMTPVAEAEAAAKALAMYGGNREEAAKKLGWSLSMLNQRLKLMSCADSVRRRLESDDQFPMGVAELLAGLRKADQDEYLKKFDELGKPSVDEFKKVLMVCAKKFATAIFDMSDCQSCPHNSSIQRSMFDMGLDDGHCMNAPCFDAKTEARLQARAEELRATYQRVQVVRPGENVLVACIAGDRDESKPRHAFLGNEQFNACRSCANFGAVVSAVPDKLGKSVGNVCFDAVCRGEKETAYKQQLADEAAALQAQVQEEATTEQASGESTGETQPKASKKAKSAVVETEGSGKEKPQAAAPTITLTNAVKEFRDALYRRVIVAELKGNPLRCAAMLSALVVSRRLTAIDSMGAAKHLEGGMGEGKDLSPTSLADNFRELVSGDPSLLKRFMTDIPLFAVQGMTPDELVKVIKILDPDWNVHFTLDESFFEKLTKGEAQAVAAQVGLDKAMGDRFATVFKEKVPEMRKALTTVEGFNYRGAIPKVLLPGFSKD